MSDYDQDNRKGYDDCEDEKYDEYNTISQTIMI